jgi:hypothetical protein
VVLPSNCYRVWRALVAGCLLAAGATAQNLDDSLGVVADTQRSAEQSQQKIDDLSHQTRLLLDEYRSLQEGIDYQRDHSEELERLAAQQRERIASLQRQVAEARITRQRIVPLMRTMADALEKFVVLDLPFHQEQRITAVLQLKQRLNRPDLSVAARFRLLLEAFQIEQSYGATLEAWRGPLQLGEDTLSVEFLRLGRVALYYLSLDRERAGYWDPDSSAWVPLDEAQRRGLAQAVRVARNQTAPRLLELPLRFPRDAS